VFEQEDLISDQVATISRVLLEEDDDD
jgi:hypothetical protein